MYIDNFELKGKNFPIRDIEARQIIKEVLGSISGTAGSEDKPIFLDNGAFKECNDVLNVNVSGNANSATEANHALTTDSATEANHALSADSATNANTANSATEASHALSADSATEANHALSADSATEANHALSADSATEANHALSADSATEANHALTADNATKANTANSATEANHALTANSATTAVTATTAINFNNDAVISAPFIRLKLTNTLGVMYLITGSVTINVNTSVQYGASYIGDFLINIPEAVRCPNGHYSVQVTCIAEGKVCLASLNATTNLTQLQGWVQSNLNSASNVIFNITILGF